MTLEVSTRNPDLVEVLHDFAMSRGIIDIMDFVDIPKQVWYEAPFYVTAENFLMIGCNVSTHDVLTLHINDFIRAFKTKKSELEELNFRSTANQTEKAISLYRVAEYFVEENAEGLIKDTNIISWKKNIFSCFACAILPHILKYYNDIILRAMAMKPQLLQNMENFTDISIKC